MTGTPGTPSYIVVTANTIKLWIHRTGRFDLQDMGVPKEGNVSIQGQKAILTVTEIAGKDIQFQSTATRESIGPIELLAQPDGQLVYNDPKALDPSPVRLKLVATADNGRP